MIQNRMATKMIIFLLNNFLLSTGRANSATIPGSPDHSHGIDERLANKQQACNNDITESKIINTIRGQLMDSHRLPTESGSPTLIQVEIHVQSITELSEITAGFETDILFSQLWLDRNLDFTALLACKKNITLGSAFLATIWTPNTCIVNTKESKIHKSPTENLFVILYQNGTVWVNYRMKANGPCDLDLRMFPFDIQTCGLAFESYSYNNEEVQLAWFPEPLTLFPKAVQLPDFELSDWQVIKTQPLYPNGQWDRLEVLFTFRRRSEFYILQAYIPTYVIIVSSWISFCMDQRILPARTTITISALLAITFQYGNIIRSLPKVSYIKAMDVWMLACVSFVFGALVELAFISLLSRRYKVGATPTHGIRPSFNSQQPRNNNKGENNNGNNNSRSNYRHLSLAPGTEEETTFPLYMTVGNSPRSSCCLENGMFIASTSDVSANSRRKYSSQYQPQFLEMHPIGSVASPRHQPQFAQSANQKHRWCNRLKKCNTCCHSPGSGFCRITPQAIDRVSLVLFPLTFLVFNICYWCYYIGRSRVLMADRTEDRSTGRGEGATDL